MTVERVDACGSTVCMCIWSPSVLSGVLLIVALTLVIDAGSSVDLELGKLLV